MQRCRQTKRVQTEIQVNTYSVYIQQTREKCYNSMIIDGEAEKHNVIRHGHLDQSSPIIPLCFDNIPISPYGPALWHTPPSRRQKSLLLLVMVRKLNLHTEQFCWDVPDARSWINIKALRAAVCLYASTEGRGKFLQLQCTAPRSFPRWKQANLRGNHFTPRSEAGMCFSLPQFITLLFDFSYIKVQIYGHKHYRILTAACLPK